MIVYAILRSEVYDYIIHENLLSLTALDLRGLVLY